MQYTFLGFSQEKLIELNLDDRDAALLRYFVNFKDTEEMYSEQHNGETYYWLKYESIRKELPIIGDRMQKDAIYRRFRHMAEIGVLKHYHKKSGGSFSFYAIGPKYYQLITSSEQPTQAELPLPPSGSKTVPSDPKTEGSDFTTGAGTDAKSEGYGSKTGAKDQSTKDQSTKKIRESEVNSPALALFFEKFPGVNLNKARKRDIVETVTNLDAWKLTMWWWELKEYRPQHTENMLDYYTTKAVPKLETVQARKEEIQPPQPDVNLPASEWEQVKAILAQRINRPSFNTWIRPVIGESSGNNGQPVKLYVPDAVFEYWIGEYYCNVIQDAYETIRGTRPELTFIVQESNETTEQPQLL